jgi:CRISPR-associated protein (TIGR02584 family)
MPPHQFKRRVLLAVTGLSPQIVTETLYALTQRRTPAFVPTDVRVVTTATGAREARLNLLAERSGWFHRLCADYRLPPIRFDAECIHVLDDGCGRALDDIRTPAENERAADFITEIVRGLTEDGAAALHVSLAGGRKTMGYYLGYALSLYGRAQDALSHVLVSEPFENNREFFYPTPYEHPIRVRRGDKEQTFDCRDAQVDLAEIPFVRLRDGLPERLRAGRAPFSRVVATANRGLQPPRLVLRPAARAAELDDEPLELTPVSYAVLLWLAERAKRGAGAMDWRTEHACNEFKQVARRVLGSASGEYERIEQALDWRKGAAIKIAKYFEPHKSKINAAIAALLGEAAAIRYAIRTTKGRDGVLYDLPLAPGQIEIKR